MPSEPPDPAKVKAVVDQAFEQWRYRADTGEKSDRYREKLQRIKGRVDEFFLRSENERLILMFALEACRQVAEAKDDDELDEARAMADRVRKMPARMGM